MKNPFATLSVAVVILAMTSGCDNLVPFSDSGIPTALGSEELLRSAGAPQGLAFSPVRHHGSGGVAGGVECESHFNVTIKSGSRGQLLASYRAAVSRMIQSKGGKLNGTGIIGSSDDVSHFSYAYRWSNHKGIVKVYSFDETNGEVQIIAYCYEHR